MNEIHEEELRLTVSTKRVKLPARSSVTPSLLEQHAMATLVDEPTGGHAVVTPVKQREAVWFYATVVAVLVVLIVALLVGSGVIDVVMWFGGR